MKKLLNKYYWLNPISGVCKGFLGLAALFMIGGCSSKEDLDLPSDKEGDVGKMYINLNLVFPQSSTTRSATENDGSSSDGTFEAYDNENTIEKLNLFFCYNDNGVEKFVKLYAEPGLQLPDNGRPTTISLEVDNETLSELAGKSDVKVYVVANLDQGNYANANNLLTFNPLEEIVTPVYADWLGFPVGNKAKFPIVSAIDYTADFSVIDPDDITLLSAGNVSGSSYETFNYLAYKVRDCLSSIFSAESSALKLERFFARVDYADNSGNKDGVYPFVSTDEECDLFVKIESICSTNISNQAYIFKHTATGDDSSILFDNEDEEGNGLTDYKLFGKERGDLDDAYNWVLDNNWAYKLTQGEAAKITDVGDHFRNRPNTNGSITDVPLHNIIFSSLYSNNRISYEDDGDTWFPLFYMPENTLPSVNSMKRGLTTGLAFKVRLCDEEGNSIPQLNSPGDLVGEDEEILYGGYITYDESKDKFILSSGDNSVELEYTSDTVIEGVSNNDGGYYLTYYYFFRHNNNNESTTGPMEFGIVRNNIYRLSVAGFNGVPKPYDPDEEDEPNKDLAMSVVLKVLAWARRDISVTF